MFEPDAVLLDSVDLARRALLDVTAPETVGSVIGHVVEDEHVLTLLFAADLGGYPDGTGASRSRASTTASRPCSRPS